MTKLSPISDVVIIVDILSFSTCVEIATNNGAVIFPYQFKDESATDYALSMQAELASRERISSGGYSLSPTSLLDIPDGAKLVLPSPNGASLTLRTGQTPTLAGCLRNAHAIANFARSYGSKISVIPAGEKWEDGTLRPALEDLVGAGAILSYCNGKLSPEAEVAVGAFQRVKDHLLAALKQCSSGKELIAKGFVRDIELSAAINSSTCVPFFGNNAYVKQKTSF